VAQISNNCDSWECRYRRRNGRETRTPTRHWLRTSLDSSPKFIQPFPQPVGNRIKDWNRGVVDVIGRNSGPLDRICCLTFHVFCKALGLAIKIMASLTSFYRPWGPLGPTPSEALNVFLVTIAKQAERVPISDRIITDIIIEVEPCFKPHRILARSGQWRNHNVWPCNT
jgi:hypothetical protein